MPFYEKEVVVNAPDSQPVTPIDSNGNRAPFRLRNAPSDPRLGKIDTTASSASGSVPASPADTYRSDPAGPFIPRNLALAASASRFGGASSPYSEISSPIEKGRGTPPAGPPKPNGFAYNPRDLRNAMLNRQAAESAAALSSAASASGRSTPPARPETPSQSFAVELPAFSVVRPRPSAETLGRASTASRASESTVARSVVSPSTNATESSKLAPEPVELSAAPSVRKPVPTSSSSNTTPIPTADPTVRENITHPVVESRKPHVSAPSLSPPPPPPKDDPSILSSTPSSNDVKSLKEKKSADALSSIFTGDEKKSRLLPKSKFGFSLGGGGKDKAPRIGEVPGLKEERKIDLDPAKLLAGAGKEGRL